MHGDAPLLARGALRAGPGCVAERRDPRPRAPADGGLVARDAGVGRCMLLAAAARGPAQAGVQPVAHAGINVVWVAAGLLAAWVRAFVCGSAR